MKIKSFICFRPVVVETETQSRGGAYFDDRVFTCMTFSNQRDSKPSVAKSRVSTRERSKASENEIRTRKRVAVNSFSGVVKAALFEISLREKARKRKVPQLILGSESSDRNRSDVLSDTNLQSDSSTSSSTLSSYSNSSPSLKKVSNKRSYLESGTPTRKKESIKSPQQTTQVQTENRVNDCLGSKAGFLILISLVITMFYGRLCAILFTSLCLYFLRSRSICQQQSPEIMVSTSPDRESSAGDYRKRVIMEGLLGRNHQPVGR